MTKDFIPFGLPLIEDEEIEEVLDTLKSGWLTSGPKTKAFEEEFSKFVGIPHAIAVNSATAGLHLALEAIGIKEGDKVITTPYTFTATAEVIRYLGADPVFVDIDPLTLNIDPNNLKDLVGVPNIKAIIPVHFAGQTCDMDAINLVAKAAGWKVIEDSAHALPATYNGKMAGTLGDVAAYSFYATKTITTGEGGMAVTADDEIAERMRCMRLHGINRDVFSRYTDRYPSWYYEVIAPGFKYNMTDIAAAIGIQQLKKAWKFQERRKKIAELYNESFKDLPLTLPFHKNNNDIHSWHLYVIQLDIKSLKISRDQFIELMSKEGIGTSVHFIPLHIQPYWKNKYKYNPDDFPISYETYQKAVSLPIYPKMSDKEVDRAIQAVNKIITQYAK